MVHFLGNEIMYCKIPTKRTENQSAPFSLRIACHIIKFSMSICPNLSRRPAHAKRYNENQILYREHYQCNPVVPWVLSPLESPSSGREQPDLIMVYLHRHEEDMGVTAEYPAIF